MIILHNKMIIVGPVTLNIVVNKFNVLTVSAYCNYLPLKAFMKIQIMHKREGIKT